MPVNQSNTEDKKFSLKGVFQKGKEYVETRYQIIRLGVIEKSSRLIAALILDAVRVVFALLVLFFLSMALGFYLSAVLGNFALGFLSTGVIFIFLIILMSLFDKPLKKTLITLSISRFLQKNDDGDEEKSDSEEENK